MNKTYRALFFDLDGTLLPLETQRYLELYAQTMNEFVESHRISVPAFRKAFEAACAAIPDQTGKLTNAEAFWAAFDAEVAACPDLQGHDWYQLMEDYYAGPFTKIGPMFPAEPKAREVIETLKAKGYIVALTTMPVFPLVAVETRLGWANIEPEIFDRITCLENSHSVKPLASYYQENLDFFGLSADEVLMVGNNTRDDLGCLDAGIEGYLLDEHLMNPNGYDLDKVRHSSIADFLEFCRSLPDLR